MKKITFTVFAFLLTVSLTGCASQQTDKPHAIGTKPPVVTEDNQSVIIDYIEDTVRNYDTYDAFLTAYTFHNDNAYVYSLPEIVNDWDCETIELEENTFYRMHYTNPKDNCKITIEIQPFLCYATADDYLALFPYKYYGKTSILKQEDRWYIEKNTEDDRSSYALYGFTGEENVYYALAVSDPNHPEPTDEDAIARLENYQDLLEFQKTS